MAAAETRYSLFPPPDDVLQSQSIRRLAARPKTPTTGTSSSTTAKRQPSMRTIREEDRSHDATHRPELAKQGQPPVIRVTVPSEPSVRSGAPRSAEESIGSAKERSPVSPPPDRPLPRAPGSLSRPRARAPALRTREMAGLSAQTSTPGISPQTLTAISPQTSTTTSALPPHTSQTTSTTDNARRHARNHTNESATSAASAFKSSPVSPESMASAGTMFSPVTPASETASVSYPLVPKLSSSPSVSSGFSPPRSRPHALGSEYAGSSSGLRRMPSVATSRPSQQSERGFTAAGFPDAATEKKGFRSLFPTYDPDVPLSMQDYRPSIGVATSRPSMSSRPSLDGPASSVSGASTTRLTEANLRVHNVTPTPTSTSPPAARPTPAPTTTATRHPPRSASVPNLNPTPATPAPRVPHADATSQPRSTTADPTTTVPAFVPPPGRPSLFALHTTPKAKQAKARAGRPRTKTVLAKRPKPATVTKTERAQAWRSTTTAVTRVSDKDGGVVTTATTTVVPSPFPESKKKVGAEVQTEARTNRWAPTHASDVAGDGEREADEGVQRGVTVALGAVAFVVGVGVEVVGGAVGGLRRKKGRARAGSEARSATV